MCLKHEAHVLHNAASSLVTSLPNRPCLILVHDEGSTLNPVKALCVCMAKGAC